MIHIHQLDDTHLLTHNPELCREVTTYLLYCRHELLEYSDADELEDHVFNFLVLTEEDVSLLSELDSDIFTGGLSERGVRWYGRCLPAGNNHALPPSFARLGSIPPRYAPAPTRP